MGRGWGWEEACELTSGFLGQGKEEKPFGGEHLYTMSIYFKFDHFRLLLILAFGSEPRREAP